MLNGLDLFSGIGGLSLALAPWVRPLAYCENEHYAQAVLLSRMQSGDITSAAIWDDVTTLLPGLLPREEIDIIYGGFPCQDISAAGRGIGLAGKRSGLFYEIVRLTEEIRPSFVFLENVPAIRTRGLYEVVGAFTDIGYDCRWTVVSAAEVGAPHLRKRWFLLAHAQRSILRGESRRERRPCGESPALAANYGQAKSLANASSLTKRKPSDEAYAVTARGQARDELIDGGSDVADSSSSGRRQRDQNARRGGGGGDCAKRHERSRLARRDRRWDIEPFVGRVAHGVPARVDRLRGLGNAVVPLQAQIAFERLMRI